MIEDHTYRKTREKLLQGWWRDGRSVAAAVFGLLLLAAQILTLAMSWHHQMPAQPPKVSVFNASLVSESPDIFAVSPTVPSSWRYYVGAIGYWLPNALNRSAQARAAMRRLRQMAASYEPLGSYADIEFLGGTLTRPVTVFRIRTIPHGVYAEMRVPTANLKNIDLNPAREDFAKSFEALFGHPGVAGVAWGQEQNAADQLEDVVFIYVSSTSGDSSSTLSFPYQRWTPAPWLTAAAAEQAFLDQSEGT